jgi:hypothetical protein
MIARSDRVVPLTDEGLGDEVCSLLRSPVRQPRRFVRGVKAEPSVSHPGGFAVNAAHA